MTQSARPDVDSRGTQPNPLNFRFGWEPSQATDYIPGWWTNTARIRASEATFRFVTALIGLTAKSVFLNTEMPE